MAVNGGRQQIELAKQLTIRTAINSDQTNIGPRKLNDLVKSEMAVAIETIDEERAMPAVTPFPCPVRDRLNASQRGR